MRGSEFAELAAFVAVADRGSFVKAAGVLGVSTSRLSQTIRALEERLGVRLLNRTTRSVAPTEAGERLLTRVRPALDELGTAVDAINGARDDSAGVLRLTTTSAAANIVIGPHLKSFVAEYPEIVLDVEVDDTYPDIVAGRFDAGIRAGHWSGKDMIAVRISPPSRLIAFASPDYLAKHPRPDTPKSLESHNCIRLLWAGVPHRWKFEKDGEKLEIAVDGSLVTNDLDLVVHAASTGVGIGYALEAHVAPLLADGRLVPVLSDWSPSFKGYYIIYPGHREMPGPLKLFIEFLRASAAPREAKSAA